MGINNILETLKEILDEYKAKEKEIEQVLIREGEIPDELCSNCQYRSWQLLPNIIDLSDSDAKNLITLAQEKKITRLYRDPYKNAIRESFATEDIYGVHGNLDLYNSKQRDLKLLKKIFKICDLGLQVCRHLIDPEDENQDKKSHILLVASKYGSLNLESAPFAFSLASITKKGGSILFLCCDDCLDTVKKRGCDRIKERGFLFNDFGCFWRENLLGLLLEKNLIEFKIKSDRHSLSAQYFLPKLNTFIVRGLIDKPKETVQKLKPDYVAVFGERKQMLDFVGMDVSIIGIEEEGLYIYDKEKPIETSLDRIVEKIAANLKVYTDTARGNNHDRVVKAFMRIGEELGFAVDAEYSKNKITVDSAWIDAEGSIFAAIEVETSGQWKKDVVSTWELEPQLAVIVTYHKTAQVAETLSKNILMKYLPHPLLYVNMLTGNAYLFKGQSLLRIYELQNT
ncbi:MAG: hypothetical protein AYK18_09600 [Theionarchaea archaeon DG-70]|nr:MAG: hypothetical protein AYK18_09600 [Theionarchaea archaeon DG-70]